jgi:large subunit ribosomal protein L28
MSRKCVICDKGILTGHKVSHSNIKTNRRWNPNIQKVNGKILGGVKVTGYVCTKCLKTYGKAEA